MNPKNGERKRLAADVAEIRNHAATLAEEIDYQERTGSTPDQRMRAWSDRLSRIVDYLDEHRVNLENLVIEDPPPVGYRHY